MFQIYHSNHINDLDTFPDAFPDIFRDALPDSSSDPDGKINYIFNPDDEISMDKDLNCGLCSDVIAFDLRN